MSNEVQAGAPSFLLERENWLQTEIRQMRYLNSSIHNVISLTAVLRLADFSVLT